MVILSLGASTRAGNQLREGQHRGPGSECIPARRKRNRPTLRLSCQGIIHAHVANSRSPHAALARRRIHGSGEARGQRPTRGGCEGHPRGRATLLFRLASRVGSIPARGRDDARCSRPPGARRGHPRGKEQRSGSARCHVVAGAPPCAGKKVIGLPSLDASARIIPACGADRCQPSEGVTLAHP